MRRCAAPVIEFCDFFLEKPRKSAHAVALLRIPPFRVPNRGDEMRARPSKRHSSDEKSYSSGGEASEGTSSEEDASDEGSSSDEGASDTEASASDTGPSSDDATAIRGDARPARHVPTTATASAALAALDAPPPGARGGIFDRRWLELAAKTHDPHMGAENLGPSLYALARFVKPKTVLEIGAGYTSLFLLQALRDNDEELACLRREKRADREAADLPAKAGQKPMAGMPPDAAWFDAAETRRLLRSPSVLHCVDDLSHAFCTAREIKRTAERLGIAKHLRMYDRDAWAGAPSACRPGANAALRGSRAGRNERDKTRESARACGPVDMLWVDFGVGHRLDAFLRLYWPSVKPGGFVVVHSTVTNRATRAWLERVRRGEFAWLETRGDAVDARTNEKKRKRNPSLAEKGVSRRVSERDEVHHVSFLEPHKRYQNAFTVLQKRPRGWREPVYTDEA